MSDDSTDQFRFGDEGELKEPEPDDDGDEEPTYNDFGEEQAWYETAGGYNRFEVTSLLQTCVRRGDEERAAWCAWELVRSGHAAKFWERTILYIVEDLRACSQEALLIDYYHRLATERWDPQSWEGRVTAIHAALTAARAPASRESTHADDYFRQVAEERAEAREEDRDPEFDFPVSDDDLQLGEKYDVALDQHTYRGQNRGRDWGHFWSRAARVGPQGEPELSRKWQRRRLEMDSGVSLTGEEIDHALTPVDPETRWKEDIIDPNENLDDFES